jgi:hypothetical protein
MRCRDVQLELSARMDGDLRPLHPDVALHADTCAACGSFQSGAARVRSAVRFAVAEPVPDLVGAVMTKVRAEQVAFAAMPPLRVRPRRRAPSLLPRLAAAALAGAVVGVAVVSTGMVSRRPSRAALATEIPQAIARVAPLVTSYSADFVIIERNWRAEVPTRTFGLAIAFQAPEQLRVAVTDRTAYPAVFAATSNTSLLQVDGARWSLDGSQSCTPQAAPTCAPVPPIHRRVSGRPPFDADALMPTDIVLPVNALAGAGQVQVLGADDVLGRDAIHVRLAADQAEPLFASFQQAGSWRPIYPADPVDLWLDRDAWLPLRFEVRSAGGPDREAWTAENGMPAEPPGALVLRGEATSVSVNEPASAAGPGPPTDAGRDRGFRRASGEALHRALGWAPVVPGDAAGLAPYRSGHFAGRREAVLSYAHGLSWLRVHETRTWRAAAPFGDIGVLAETVALPGGGVAFYEPAGLRTGRRLSIHTGRWDLYLESNLPREDLLRVAASLPVTGLPQPASWRVRRGPGGSRTEVLGVDDGLSRAGFPLLLPAPPSLPAGVRPVAAELRTRAASSGSGALTLLYRRPGIEVAGYALRLYQAPNETLPPPSGADAVQVRVRGALARWSPTAHQLEWVEDGRYLSLTAPGLGLEDLAVIAERMRLG